MMAQGSLLIAGTGISLAGQCTSEAREAIAQAGVVYSMVGDGIAESWLRSVNSNVISLQDHYGGGRTRAQTYEAMTETILNAVRAGQNVCAVFYGHPGVYVWPSHEAVRRARDEGFSARMLPGVSAEDCLIADLGVDPGRTGWQSYEATDFFLHARKVDPTASLVLWQIAVVGDRSLRVMEADPRRLQLLADVLMETYPARHDVTIYEAATLPIGAARIERLPLAHLAEAVVTQQSTLYVPPLRRPSKDSARLARLEGL
jgi:uncharacterized protein YabN with tetrapyrrole methylase and pyrophosphatase domain